MKKNLTEGKNYNGQDTHFAVNKNTGLIVFGWDYSGYDSSELRQFSKDYFMDDLREYGFNPKEYKILSYKACVKNGIGPNDDSKWSNDGQTPCLQPAGLSESQLHRVIKESIRKVLMESIEGKYTLHSPLEIYLPNSGEKYYVWSNGFGDFYGTSDIEGQRQPISNARNKQVFTRSQGFETIEDVRDYALQYFDR